MYIVEGRQTSSSEIFECDLHDKKKAVLEISEERSFLAEGKASVTDQIYHRKVLSDTTVFILIRWLEILWAKNKLLVLILSPAQFLPSNIKVIVITIVCLQLVLNNCTTVRLFSEASMTPNVAKRSSHPEVTVLLFK